MTCRQRDHCRPRPRYSTTLTNHVIALPAPPAEPCPDLDLLCHRATRFASGALPWPWPSLSSRYLPRQPSLVLTLTFSVIALPAPPAEPCPDLDILCHRVTCPDSRALPWPWPSLSSRYPLRQRSLALTLTFSVIALPASLAEPCPDLDLSCQRATRSTGEPRPDLNLLCHRATSFASGALSCPWPSLSARYPLRQPSLALTLTFPVNTLPAPPGEPRSERDRYCEYRVEISWMYETSKVSNSGRERSQKVTSKNKYSSYYEGIKKNIE